MLRHRAPRLVELKLDDWDFIVAGYFIFIVYCLLLEPQYKRLVIDTSCVYGYKIKFVITLLVNF